MQYNHSMHAQRYSPRAGVAWTPFVLALVATATAVSMAAVAGWERGGWLAERLLLVALGTVLTVSAHLMPALCRRSGWRVMIAAAVLWAGCSVAACYGHATFFLAAQEHAGARRADAQAEPVDASVLPTTTALAPLVKARADVVTAIARLDGLRCTSECRSVRVRRVALAGQLDVLDARLADAKLANEAVEAATTQQANADAVRRELRADPLTSRIAAALHVPESRIDLASGMLFAAVLEGVACLCWLLAMPAAASIRVSHHGTVTAHSREESNDAGGHGNGSHGAVTLSGGPDRADNDGAAPVAVTSVTARVTGNGHAVTVSNGSHAVVARPSVTVAPDVQLPLDLSMSPDGPRMEFDAVAHVTRGLAEGAIRGTVAEIRRYAGCSQHRAMQLRRQLIQDGVLA